MTEPKPKRRGRGRPKASSQSSAAVVTREAVIDLAYAQSKTRSLDKISFVQLAKELDVVPGALHYHVGTKDDLTSAVLNRFYRELLRRLDEVPEGLAWREEIALFARILMECARDHRGAAEHIQSHAMFRVFQKVREGEVDFGAKYLDRAFAMFQRTGFDASTAALFYHVLALHCLSAATSSNSRLEPSAHEDFLSAQAIAYPAGAMPGLEFALRAFSRIRADEAFDLGLSALLDHFAPVWRHKSDGNQVASGG